MRQLVFLLLAGLIMAGLFVFFAPEAPPQAELTQSLTQVPGPAPASKPTVSDTRADPPPRDTPEPAPAVKRFRLEVGEQGLVSGPAVIRVRQGDQIELELVSTIDDELHLHGYDRHLHLAAGKTAVLKLSAELSGRFDYELHKRHLELGALEVLPQ